MQHSYFILADKNDHKFLGGYWCEANSTDVEKV